VSDGKDPFDDLRQKFAAIPDLLNLRRIVVEFCRLPPPDEHFHAVQLLCSATMEHYRAILALVEEVNGWPAKVLSRAVLETLTTAVILARHPEKLEDFPVYRELIISVLTPMPIKISAREHRRLSLGELPPSPSQPRTCAFHQPLQIKPCTWHEVFAL
jgi:hypothetical protein